MMNSYRQNNRSRRRLWAATLLVISLFVLDVLSGGKIRGEARAATSLVSRLGFRVGNTLAGSGIFSGRAALEAQNRSLADEVAQLEVRAAADTVLQQENDQLRAMVHLAHNASGITAPVVSSFRASPYGTFLIGAGESGGVARGDLVLSEGGFVVGRVSDTNARTALVTEVFAPGASIDAVVDSTSISLEGQGGGNARGEVPRALAVGVGDPVEAPSLGGRAVGIVGAVASSSASATQSVYIRFPVDFSALQFVYVIPVAR